MHKVCYLSAALIANDSVIDKVFGSMHQRVVAKMKNYFTEDWIVKTIWGK